MHSLLVLEIKFVSLIIIIILTFLIACTWSSERSYEQNLQKINSNWIK